MHGLFDTRAIAARWLTGIGLESITLPPHFGWTAKERAYEQLCDHFKAHVDVDAICRLVSKEEK
jgi:hypothetical protein